MTHMWHLMGDYFCPLLPTDRTFVANGELYQLPDDMWVVQYGPRIASRCEWHSYIFNIWFINFRPVSLLTLTCTVWQHSHGFYQFERGNITILIAFHYRDIIYWTFMLSRISSTIFAKGRGACKFYMLCCVIFNKFLVPLLDRLVCEFIKIWDIES